MSVQLWPSVEGFLAVNYKQNTDRKPQVERVQFEDITLQIFADKFQVGARFYSAIGITNLHVVDEPDGIFRLDGNLDLIASLKRLLYHIRLFGFYNGYEGIVVMSSPSENEYIYQTLLDQNFQRIKLEGSVFTYWISFDSILG